MAISRISGVPLANIAKVNGVAIANIEKVSGVEKEAGVGPTVYIEDSFTGSDGTAIIGRLPDVVDQGGAWFNAGTEGAPEINNNNMITTGNTRPGVAILPGVSDYKITYDLLDLQRGTSTNSLCGARSTQSGTFYSTWNVYFYVNNNFNPRLELREDNTVRDTKTMADIWEPGVCTMICNGQTITGNWKTASLDETVSYDMATQNENEDRAVIGSQGTHRVDNYKIEAP